MIELIKLEATNALTWQNVSVNLQDKGLVIVSGENAAGKSNLFSVLVPWCLFGDNPKGYSGAEIIRWGEKRAQVSVLLHMEGDRGPLKITRTRTKTKEVVTINDGQAGTSTEMQPTINRLLNCTYKTFINSTIMAQGKITYLAQATDGERKDVYAEFFGLRALDKAYADAKNHADGFSQKLQFGFPNVDEQIETLQRQLNTYKQQKADREQHKQEQIDHIRNDIQAVTERMNSIRNPQLIDGFDKDEFDRLTRESINLLSKIKSNEQEVEKIQRKLEKIQGLNGIECNSCFQVVDTDSPHYQKIINEDKSRMLGLMKLVEKETKLYEECTNEIDKHRQAEQRWIQYQSDLRNYNTTIQNCQASLEQLRVRLEEAESWTDNTEWEKEFKYVCDKIAELQNQRKNITKQRVELQEMLSYAEFFKTLFSKKGAHSVLSETYLGDLERNTNHFLGPLSRGVLRATLCAQSTTTGGKIIEKSEYVFEKDGIQLEYHQLSDGERHRADIASVLGATMTIRQMNRANFGFLILDEILDISLSEAGQDAVIDALHSILRTEAVKTIIVISPKGEQYARTADEHLRVTYNGISSKIE